MYRYLIAKRAATAEYEANADRFAANPWTKSQEFADLSNCLRSSGKTLYDVEASLVDQICEGKL